MLQVYTNKYSNKAFFFLNFISILETKYEVIKFVGKKILQWKLNYEQESNDWDVYWTDNAVQPD